MAGIDLLPVPGNAPKPSPADVGGIPATGKSDAGSSPFGTVLSESMKPSAPRQTNAKSTDRSSDSRTDRAPVDRGVPAKRDGSEGNSAKPRNAAPASSPTTKSQPAASKSGSTTTTESTQAPPTSEIESDGTDAPQESDVASQAPVVAPAEGTAPAQLIAGMLLAQANQTTPNPAPIPETARKDVSAGVAAISKPPQGLLAALEQSPLEPTPVHDSQIENASEPIATAPEMLANKSAETPSVTAEASAAAAETLTPTEVALPGAPSMPESNEQPDGSEPQSNQPVAKADASPVAEEAETPAGTVSVDTPGNKVETAAPEKEPLVSPLHSRQVDRNPTPDAPRSPRNSDNGKKEEETTGKAAGGPTTGAPVVEGESAIVGMGQPGKGGDGGEQDMESAADLLGQSTNGSADASDTKRSDTQPASNPLNASGSSRRLESGPVTNHGGTERIHHPAQVIDQIAQGVQFAHQSGERMQLRLQPAELGNVQIDVTMRDGLLSARLEAQSPGTHQLLVDNLPQLKESLAQQGVQVDRLEVDLSDTFRNESSAGGFTGRPFEQHQHAEHGSDWEPNVPPQPGSERTVNAEARMSPARGSRGPITSLDVMV